MKELFILNSLGVGFAEEPPFARVIGTREDWAALGVVMTTNRDDYGWIAYYRGAPTASLWLAERRRHDLAGVLNGSCPLQGYGVVDAQPFYFRARHDHWSLSIAKTLDEDPINTPCFVWGDEYSNASYMDEEVGWECVDAAVAIFREPLVQELINDAATTPEAYRASRCWHALAYAAARDGGPVEHIRRTLWTFGIHPVMDLDADGRVEWYLPVEHTIEPTTHAAARTAAGAGFEAAVCDAIRAVWPR